MYFIRCNPNDTADICLDTNFRYNYFSYSVSKESRSHMVFANNILKMAENFQDNVA